MLDDLTGGRQADAWSMPGEGQHLARCLDRLPRTRPHRELFEHYFDTDIERQVLARRLGLRLGRLLRIFNETAPLEAPRRYRHRGGGYLYRAMWGLCDDYHGPRFGKFGEPFVLRVYLDQDEGVALSQELFEIADWNFMDAGLPSYVGYIYGTRADDVLFVSGIQSDLAQRYAFLFQGRGPSEVRENDEVELRDTSALAARFASEVPALRRRFQRQWIPALLCSALDHVQHHDLRGLAIQHFLLEPEEDGSGHVVRRIYRGLTRSLGATPLDVRTERSSYRYGYVPLATLRQFLSLHFQPLG
jgi:hypothetical protein